MARTLVVKDANFLTNRVAHITFDVIHATGITLSQSEINLDTIGGTATLTYTLTPSDAEDPVLWESSNPSVASASNGVITVNGCGSCRITARAGNVTAFCDVTVSVYLSGFERVPQMGLRPFSSSNTITSCDNGVGTNSFRMIMSALALDTTETHMTLDQSNATGTETDATIKPQADRTSWSYTRVGWIIPIKLPQGCTKIRVLSLNNNYKNYPLWYKFDVGNPAYSGGVIAWRKATGWTMSGDITTWRDDEDIPWETGQSVEYDVPSEFDSVTITWLTISSDIPNFKTLTEEQLAEFKVLCM